MKLSLLGLSHKSSPVELREALARLPHSELYAALRREGSPEAVILSTCNRFEVYLFSRESDAPAKAETLLAELSGRSLEGRFYARGGSRAVEHLFEVAGGLDSLIVGESEILGQVKAAYETARDAGMTGKLSNVLFQRALNAGKKVRHDTGIAMGQISTASVAAQLAERIFGGLRDREVLILGAGHMAELSAKHLLGKKVGRIKIANRTWSRGAELAEKLSAEPCPWEEFPRALAEADIVVASTGSAEPVITRSMVAEAMKSRSGRSLFLIDIAMPRDVEESVHGLDHAYLYRLEDLEGIVAENLESRGAELERARQIARAKAAEFCSWHESVLSGREVSLRRHAAERQAA
ncbi:MAG: glutamyl-tRNA reductase [Elusimicrobia bacterium]|nr:glutamyl-tRNA reductase [Elusimicrobiota bacterium]